MNERENKQKQQHCCLSHEFLRAATLNPNKIAVIHAATTSSSSFDGAEFSRKLINASDSSSSSSPSNHFHPPVYEGDRCFTFAEVSASVDSLSSRLFSILHGSDDPHLITPQQPSRNNLEGEQPASVYTFTSSTSNEEKMTDFVYMYTPKVIGIYMPPSVEYIVSVLSILRIGEAFLPLDPFWPKDRILSTISSSNVDLVIACGTSFSESGCYPLDKSHWLVECGTFPVLCFSIEERAEELIHVLNFFWPCDNERQRSFCYLMYTSGSTGKPKGVCGTEQGLLNRFLWMQDLYPPHGEDILLFKTSISFIDHLQEIFSAILTACTLVIPPVIELKRNLISIIEVLQAYSISRFTTVPSLMRAILPALQSQLELRISSSLKLLVLSGEVLPISLWDMVSKLLPKTSILNLYGSTEVSGDCLYFDCKRLPMILDKETLISVPIGMPISHCDVVLAESDSDTPNQGEIYVGGLCVFNGYFSESAFMSSEYVRLHQNSISNHSVNGGSIMYFRTGDFAKRLQSGDLVFMGRKDRTIKVNGQRMALEEIEFTLQEHPDVADAAVNFHKVQEELPIVEAFIVLQEKEKSSEICISSIKNWMINKLPLAMIPNRFICIESLPMTPSGKVDYALLVGPTIVTMHPQDEIVDTKTTSLLQVIKKAFGDALTVEEVFDNDNFFVMGGNSIAAAHVAHNLGIDMRLIYNFPTPSKLQTVLLQKKVSYNRDDSADAHYNVNQEADKENTSHSVYSSNENLLTLELLRTRYEKNENNAITSKRLKVDSDKQESQTYSFPRPFHVTLKLGQKDGLPWNCASSPMSCSFSRCNKIMYEEGNGGNDPCLVTWSVEVPGNRKGFIQEFWKVYMESCVDASPILVLKDSDFYLFVGSHSRKFLCVDVKSGCVQWETKLEGRVECSAAVVGDFSLVVVGCYKGKIYFLDFSNGSICWTFQTCGEVKCQPVIDAPRQLVWCGSHDHSLYGLDFTNRCCVYKISCGGSIFGSPAIDEVRDALYVASTSGRLTAISVKALPFHTLWQHELEVPVFGSLSVTSPNRYVICCLVDGHVVALDSSGSIIWRYRTGGPVFAGACTSSALPSQVLVCSRNGSIYSFEPEKGNLLWEYGVGDPITASAYVDENLQLISESSSLADRLVCVCTSSGSIYILRINLDVSRKENHLREKVQEFARLDLQGDIFSSPVMIGGRIFVGCRDDYVRCIAIGTQNLVEE
ncbi:hypothetical protein ACOSQ4_014248 [Xanthoceras sorbifolium]